MERQTQTAEIPKWAALLVEAVNKPGLIMEAYSAFHNYSIGNQLLALIQCQMRGLQPGPINTFPKWQTLGRVVKRGERALMLCMPLTRKRRDQESNNNDATGEEHTYTTFVHRARWFVVCQTVGSEIKAPEIPEWNAERALANLNVERIDFDSTDGNCQGFARKRQIAINPIAQLPFKTLFHETAHVILGHTAEGDFADTENTPRSLREVEAEAVALLCCESLGLEGAEYCRGYIQNWLYQGAGYNADAIPEKSAQKILHAADQILRAGRPTKERAAENAN
ncbi:MAG: hypothetical protein QOH71_191 [Blastocatellia bacterium]|jgi:hypothetical protein|nr:hypothetical protein [Blastocatellia bacterium]